MADDAAPAVKFIPDDPAQQPDGSAGVNFIPDDAGNPLTRAANVIRSGGSTGEVGLPDSELSMTMNPSQGLGDFLKAAGTGLIRGPIEALGTPGNLIDLGNYAYHKVTGTPVTPTFANNIDSAAISRGLDNLGFFPYHTDDPYLSAVHNIAGMAGGNVGLGLIGKGAKVASSLSKTGELPEALTAGKIAGDAVKDAVTGTGAGVGVQLENNVSDYIKAHGGNVPWWADILGQVVAGGIGGGVAGGLANRSVLYTKPPGAQALADVTQPLPRMPTNVPVNMFQDAVNAIMSPFGRSDATKAQLGNAADTLVGAERATPTTTGQAIQDAAKASRSRLYAAGEPINSDLAHVADAKNVETIPDYTTGQTGLGASRVNNILGATDVAVKNADAQISRGLLRNLGTNPNGTWSLDKLMDAWEAMSPEAKQALTQNTSLADQLDKVVEANKYLAEKAQSAHAGPTASTTLGHAGLAAGFGAGAVHLLSELPHAPVIGAAIGTIPAARYLYHKMSPMLPDRLTNPTAGPMMSRVQSVVQPGINTAINPTLPGEPTQAPQPAPQQHSMATFPDIYTPPVTQPVPAAPANSTALARMDRPSATAYLRSVLPPDIAGQVTGGSDAQFRAGLINLAMDPRYRTTLFPTTEENAA
jgi:hypothetical protein